MDIKCLVNEYREWLEAHEIDDVEIEENVGAEEDMTTITFPIDEGGEYPSYDIVASIADGAPLFLCGEYCDIPDVDELELLRFVNDLNRLSPLTFTVEDDALCFSYSLPLDYVEDSSLLANAFFFVWDEMDAVREDICEAFGLLPEEGNDEAAEDEAAEDVSQTSDDSEDGE